MSGRVLIALASAAAALLVAAYLAAGGSSYEPTPVADPCAPREWRSPEGVEEIGQQFALSALDGAACELGVSRETLAVALATPESRSEFAAEQGISEAELERAIRAGVVRAVDDAEDAGAIEPVIATALRAIATRLPVGEAVDAIAAGGDFLDRAEGVLGGIGGLLPYRSNGDLAPHTETKSPIVLNLRTRRLLAPFAPLNLRRR